MKSLADLQLEREKIRAHEAQEGFETAIKNTCSRDELITSAIQARQLILSIIDKMQSRLLEAIDGEFDETRVHYLMSDALIDLMHQLSNDIENSNISVASFKEYFKRGSKPRDLLTVSQWADRNRWLQSGTNSPGRWNTSLTPYLREIMDSLSEHSPVRDVTFIKSSGLGGTEAMYNWLGYIMHHLQNKDLLVVVPTLELRDRSFNPRMSKMIDETEVLAELVSHASRSKANRGDLMEYGARSRIIKAGANSPDSLRSDHLPYVICDEVDAFPWDVGGEGDPMTLIENRQRTFSRAKSYFVSTPTNDQASRIEVLYKRSDMRRYYVPCPHCNEYQTLKLGGKETPYGLKWKMSSPQDDEPAQILSVQYLCEHCATLIDEGYKPEMLSKGRWIADRPHIKAHRGYHLNALYAPIGLGLGWRAIVEKWISSQNDTSELKAFVNTYLGEVWTEQGDAIDPTGLLSRLEIYPENLQCLARTAGVDVQKDRLEITIDDWMEGEECYRRAHVIIPGDTAQMHVWQMLEEEFKQWNPDAAAIDSGYNTSMVYAFVESKPYCFAVKGMSGAFKPIVEDQKARFQRLRRQRKKGVMVHIVGVDQAKTLLFARLKITMPGAGYIHFPQNGDFDDEYFAQLTSEKLVTRIRGTRPIQEWVQTRTRNEALDCHNYSLAALRLANIDLEARAKKRQQPTTEKPKAIPRKPNNFIQGWK